MCVCVVFLGGKGDADVISSLQHWCGAVNSLVGRAGAGAPGRRSTGVGLGKTEEVIFEDSLEVRLSCCLVIELCPLLCNPVDYSPPGSSVPGISQARILEWLPFPPPGDLPNTGIEPMSPALAGFAGYTKSSDNGVKD